MTAFGRILAFMAVSFPAMQILQSTGQENSAAKSAFDQCAVCHSIDGTNGTGPTLKGIIGRRSGTVDGFRYSRAMRAAGITWNEQSLNQYLSNPQEFIVGNVMPFSGVPDPAERTEIIAYLRSLK